MPAQAMLSTAPGGPETLVLTDIPLPQPGPGEIRVAVKAAAANFPDTLIIRDLYQYKPARPFAPGGEIAGLVEAVGPDVTDFALGDRVLALTLSGGFATHIVIPAASAIPFPEAMPFDEAASFIFTYGTSFYALADRAALQKGETLLVLGAAGGIGASAVELGRAMGARVIAAVSSDGKAAFARDLGADEVLIYPTQMDKAGQRAFGQQIKAVAPDGVDVVYDPVGGAYAEPALRSLAWEGRFLVVGFPAGIPSIPLNLPLLKGCQIVGVFWGAFTARDPVGFAAHQDALFDLYARGQIRPRISAHMPLDRAADALEMIASRRALGKIVLTMP